MTSNNFKNFDLSKKTLIISDIEGYEKIYLLNQLLSILKTVI